MKKLPWASVALVLALLISGCRGQVQEQTYTSAEYEHIIKGQAFPAKSVISIHLAGLPGGDSPVPSSACPRQLPETQKAGGTAFVIETKRSHAVQMSNG